MTADRLAEARAAWNTRDADEVLRFMSADLRGRDLLERDGDLIRTKNSFRKLRDEVSPG